MGEPTIPDDVIALHLGRLLLQNIILSWQLQQVRAGIAPEKKENAD